MVCNEKGKSRLPAWPCFERRLLMNPFSHRLNARPHTYFRCLYEKQVPQWRSWWIGVSTFMHSGWSVRGHGYRKMNAITTYHIDIHFHEMYRAISIYKHYDESLSVVLSIDPYWNVSFGFLIPHTFAEKLSSYEFPGFWWSEVTLMQVIPVWCGSWPSYT